MSNQIDLAIDKLPEFLKDKKEQNGIVKISFRDGFFQEKEGYKHDLYSEYREILDIENWNENDIGKGDIAKRFVSILTDSKKNNLIDQAYNVGHYVSTINGNISRFEDLMYQLYKTENGEETFEKLVELFGARYELLGFLYFIKNKEKYLPIRPISFRARLDALGLETECTKKCSWNNYIQFVEEIKEVQKALINKGYSDVDLLDAHSFVWWAEEIVFGPLFFKRNVIRLNDISKKRLSKKTKKELISFYKKEDSLDDEYRRAVLEQDEDDEKIQYSLDDVKEKIAEKIEDPGTSDKPSYKRNPMVGKRALAVANYKCLIDSNHQSFIRKGTKHAYMEPHHLIPMMYQNEFKYSLDNEANVVSLCSNCHNQIHYGEGGDKLIKELYSQRNEYLKKAGLNITLENLLFLYGYK